MARRVHRVPFRFTAFRALVSVGVLLGSLLSGTARLGAQSEAPAYELVVSVAEQKMALLCDGGLVAKFPISTSKFGVGDSHGSYKTPLGRLHVCDKIGNGLPSGAVIKHRSATGEVLAVNAPGRDPIVTRILWLEGDEEQNRNAKERGIYIHGTPEERNLGMPVSWGCIRMRSVDVLQLFELVQEGTSVVITSDRFPRYPKYDPHGPQTRPEPMLVASTRSAPKAPARATGAGSPRGPFVSEPLAVFVPSGGATMGPSIGKGGHAAMAGSILMAGLPAVPRAEVKRTVTMNVKAAAPVAAPKPEADELPPEAWPVARVQLALMEEGAELGLGFEEESQSVGGAAVEEPIDGDDGKSVFPLAAEHLPMLPLVH